jgi:hypothetical protein
MAETLFLTEKACPECQGTGKCSCCACHHINGDNCLFCNPSKRVIAWRAMTYEKKLGPLPVRGGETHTRTQRYLSYLP